MIDMLDLADKATRCTLGKYPTRWTPEDWQDARQEAAAGMCAVMRRQPAASEALLLTAGKHAIYDWLRGWLRYRRGGTLLEYRNYAPDDVPQGGALALERIQTLAPLLAQARIRTSTATQNRVQQDIQFLCLIVQGYSIDGVAQEMGLTRRATYAIRERLLPRLTRIAAGEPTPIPRVTVRSESLAALHRINSDPALRAQRGAAIRAGLARKKECGR